MSEGKAQFFAWARRGLAASLPAHADEPEVGLPKRATLPLSITIGIGRGGETASVDVPGIALQGPGDVASLAAELIAKRVPVPDTRNFMPNRFPVIEFTDPDIPWLFTPVGPTRDNRLQPWLVLVCVEEREGVSLGRAEGGMTQLVLDGVPVAGPGGELPPAEEAWAWAHVQVTGAPTDDLEATFASQPDRVVSRLVCPRQLFPDRNYIAALVPLFEAGRRAGLGLNGEGDRLYAWDASDKILQLPVFDHWRFATGAEGDFEALGRLLEPGPVSADLGQRVVDMQDPGFDTARAVHIVRAPRVGAIEEPGELPFPLVETRATREAAICSVLRAPVQSGGLPVPPSDIGDPLRSLLTKADGTQDPPVKGPPIWGRYAAGADGLHDCPAWLSTANQTIAGRAAAGVGAEIVRSRQEQLMAAAWDQVGPIGQVNDALGRAQLSREVSRRLYRTHLRVPDAACGQGAAPTAEGLLQIVGGALKRVRSNGSLAQNRSVAAELEAGGLGRGLRASPLRRVTRPGGLLNRLGKADRGALVGALVDTARRRPGKDMMPRQTPETLDAPVDAMPREAQDLVGLINHAVHRPTPDPVRWQSVNDGLCAGLDPERSVPRRLRSKLTASARALVPDETGTEQPLAPLLAAPRFDTPMYHELKRQGQNWMLAGLDTVARNRITLVETDPQFLEAFFAGLNHEMGAELLWRGYPTDRRGTPFRTFWDRSGCEGGEAEDIRPMVEWGGRLGSNGRSPPAGHMVVLIRGDLLRAFPGTFIYALPASTQGGAAQPDFDATPVLPIFRGDLDPDVVFLGFPLTEDRVRRGGARDPGGWFFLMENQASEPAFGLGETLEYDDSSFTFDTAANDSEALDWGHLAGPQGTEEDNRKALEALSYVPVRGADTAVQGLTGWNTNAAQMARIALQLDVRFAYHADRLLGDPA